MEQTPARLALDKPAERPRDKPRYVDGRRLEALMDIAAQGSARHLLAAATEMVVDLLGERGSCVLVDGGPRVVLATHAPGINNLPVDLARYPEVRAALEGEAVVAVEDVQAEPLLAPVRELLPRRLGAVAVVPLVVADHRLGVLMAQSTSKRAMTAEAIATAALIGRFTALVLEARLGKRVDLVLTGQHPTLDPAVGPEPPAPTAEGRSRVLVVDDDPEHARALAAALRHGGYDVDIALDGADGVRRAQERAPDLIMMGVCLPVLDGLSAAERLRDDPRTRNVPIIFLSGVDELLPRARRTTFERCDYLSRSEALPELLASVHRSIRG